MDEPRVWALLQTLSRDLSEVRAEVSGVRREVAEMREQRIRQDAREEALAEQDAAVRALPGRLAELERSVEARLREEPDHHRAALRDPEVRSWAWRLSAMFCATVVVVAGIMAGIVTALPEGTLTVFGI